MIAEHRRDMADSVRRQFAECEQGMRHLLGRGCDCPENIPFLLSALEAAEFVCFLRDRLHFVNGHTGKQSRSSFASVLMGWGEECVEAIRRADLGWSVGRETTAPTCICVDCSRVAK